MSDVHGQVLFEREFCLCKWQSYVMTSRRNTLVFVCVLERFTRFARHSWINSTF